MSPGVTIHSMKVIGIILCSILVSSPTRIYAENSDPSDRPSPWPSIYIASNEPSVFPTDRPSSRPTDKPSLEPSKKPSSTPTYKPSLQPSKEPSIRPTFKPSLEPSKEPSSTPTFQPSLEPSRLPTSVPTILPSWHPSLNPSEVPTDEPTTIPSDIPSMLPSDQPSNWPTTSPSLDPSTKPSRIPSIDPTLVPSYGPSETPTSFPSSRPSLSLKPSAIPTSHPSVSIYPTDMPSSSPSVSNIPSTAPTAVPTVQPSSWPSLTASMHPSNVPTSSPTELPTTYDCTENYDTVGEFYVEELESNKDCLWVASDNTESKCEYSSVRKFCPVTCGLCPGPPSAEPSLRPSKSPTMTPTISFSPVSLPSFMPTRSALPSMQPSPTPPIPLTTTVSIELSPSQGRIMNTDEKELFEDTASSWIRPLLNAHETVIQLSSLKVTEQEILAPATGRRQLQGDNSRLLVKIQVEGTCEVTEQNTKPTDIDYDNIVKRYFSTKETSDDLIQALQTSSDANSIFFTDITNLGLVTPGNSINDGPQDGKDKKTISNNDIIIIACAVSGGAIVLFGAAMYAYTRKKRNNNNATAALVSMEQDVELDMENIFPDIELSDSKKSGGSKDEDWEAIQPQKPQPTRPLQETKINQRQPQLQPQLQQRPQSQPQQQTRPESRTNSVENLLDDATEGGRSLKTYDTLENIYSGENDNASYQSYGYSLDDGIGSKRSISPSNASNSVSASGPMKMDLYALNSSRYNFTEDDDTLEVSVGTPGSIYSGLTTDDASLRGEGKYSFGADKKQAITSTTTAMDDNVSSPSFVRECQAPPGKLGIVIDTTKDGPVVYQVKSGSPLENIIFAGDKIIGIDDIDTRGMTASNVTKIMARKCDEPRKLIVSSKTYKGTY